jgi:hypothetical protein
LLNKELGNISKAVSLVLFSKSSISKPEFVDSKISFLAK